MSSRAGAGSSSMSFPSGAVVGSARDTDAHLLGSLLLAWWRVRSLGAQPIPEVGEQTHHATRIAADEDGAQADDEACDIGDAERVANAVLDGRTEPQKQRGDERPCDRAQAEDGDDQQGGQAH